MSDDEKLMTKLLYFAVEDYFEDWASRQFKRTIRSACKRLGITYSKYGMVLMNNIEARVLRDMKEKKEIANGK